LADTLREIEERDRRDSERAIAPLRKAADSMVIDSSSLDADTVAARALAEIKKKKQEN
jgi:cytidylate kinase